jgi:intracellular sulfur oxidation DsrE/DsrF family protein
MRHQLINAVLAGLVAIASLRGAVAADEPELKFPGEAPKHKVVYQFNKADEDYQKAILFSVGAMLRKYGDDIHIVVVAIGPGIHILAKQPKRPVPEEIKQRVSSLSDYGVEFHACGNTMKSQQWADADMLPFAKVVEVGASDLMELQEQGYAYVSW